MGLTCPKAVLECCDLLGEDLTAVDYEGAPVGAHLEKLVEKLRELRDAFEARDMVVPDEVRERIEACADLDVLERWLRRAVKVESPTAKPVVISNPVAVPAV